MRSCFEVSDWDGCGRIGSLRVPRAGTTVETPALMPVINPNLVTVTPDQLATEFGAEILITNSYIIHNNDDLRQRARTEGLHEMLDFPGVIVTDSGSFQLSEYGEIDVTSAEILDFQAEIGADIGTPIDIPSPPDVSAESAMADLETTQERLERAVATDVGDMLVNAPIQGSTHTDLRTAAAEHAYSTSLDVFPVGAAVPLLNEYRFADVIDIVAAAKRGLGADAPVHLFGAGHPMMFALAVAMGCDLFDSAAYALYARDDRYLTVRGTHHLEDLEYLPCSCPICVDHTPASLESLDRSTREEALTRHNLHVSFTELRRIKAAIRAGNLLELVDQRARGHPALLDGYRTLLSHTDLLEQSDPVSKGTFFYTSHESARRPEVSRHHKRLARLSVPESLLLIDGTRTHDDAFEETWRLVPPFGPVPPALSQTYPLTAETPDRVDESALTAAVAGIQHLHVENPETSITLRHRDWPTHVLEMVPADIETSSLESDP